MLIQPYSGNLFLLPQNHTEIAAVTTNGVINHAGRLVMGKGIALYCRDRYTGIAEFLAQHVRQNGNVPAWCGYYPDPDREAKGLDPLVGVVSCPTKNHWRDDADLDLIKHSCESLAIMADHMAWTKIYLPALGCGNGRLSWDAQVRPACEAILDDRFVAAIPAKYARN